MKKKMRILYWSVEINLVLWLMIMGPIWVGEQSQALDRTLAYAKTITLIGLLFSASIQHYAYYNVRKELKK
ncbi:MAG: hypothetical protein FVQ79_12275 [Planctomycetes bacterium]|nr:hypothetical protein [Planctomycetota bacterium]